MDTPASHRAGSEPAATAAPSRWMPLVGAVERLATIERLEDVIAVVRETARSISGADGITFVLRDGEFCQYVDEDAVTPLWKGKRFPLTACISGWCMLNDERAVIPNIYVDPRIPHDAYRPTFVKSLVMVPVKVDTPIAAIGSYWAEERQFSDDEVAVLEALARSTSAAIATVRMREDLRENEQRLRMALAAGRLGVWELDLASRELTASPLCKTIFGYPADGPLTAAQLIAAIHPDDYPRQREIFERAIDDHSDLFTECRCVWPDASVHWISMRGRAVRDANGAASRLSCVVADVSERRLAKERMDHLNAEIAHIGRLTEMGQMVSAFAHELRQPLTAANNYLSAAKRIATSDGASTERLLELIGKADGQFTRATQIIQRIRGFAGKTEAETAAEDVAALISEASELAQLDPRHRGVDVRLEVADGLPPAFVDKVQVQQVLLNLLRNAFEATEGCDPRTVTARAHLNDAGEIEISVADTGPGLSPEVAAKLFQPFITTKDNGMGVGLSICRTIIESHGGKMWAESEPGRGATFLLTVPVAAPPD